MTTTNITYLGVNFWRQLVLIRPSDYFGAGNALLLCLDAEGHLLHHFFLTQESISSSPIAMRACVTLAKGIGASSLVRVQTQASEASFATTVLYETAHLYGLHLVEVLLLRFTQISPLLPHERTLS